MGVYPSMLFQRERRLVAGRLLDAQIDGPADRIAILIGGERLIDGHRTDQVGGNRIQIHLADFRIGAGDNDSVDGGVAQPRFRSANLHILPFSFIPLQGDAGESANRVSNVRIRQALNLRVCFDIQNVGGGPLFVDRRHIPAKIGAHHDLLAG